MRKLRVGPGGVAAELGLIDPRKAVREPASPQDIEQAASVPTNDDNEAWIARPMVLQPLPGRGKRRPGRVRWYHLVTKEGRTQRCWAFTTTKRVWELVRSGDPLTAAGSVYPDGQPVVPEGANPGDYSPRCGSCGTQSIIAPELVFFEE